MRVLILAIFAALVATSQARAGGMAEMNLHYVIKVTPTLVYLDAGAAVASVGDEFLVLRVKESDRRYIQVGEVRVIRVFDEFAIAEIVSVAVDEEIAVLNRAISWQAYDHMGADMLAVGKGALPPLAGSMAMTRSRSVHVQAGLGFGTATDLVWIGDFLSEAKDVTDRVLGLRLAKMVTPNWRLNTTYLIAGKPLQPDADVTQLAIEFGAHYLFRGSVHPGLYVGAGAAFHQLSWDSPSTLDDTAYKTGLTGTVGLELPMSEGWSLFAEGGYQHVLKYANVIDASNVRLAVGLGRYF